MIKKFMKSKIWVIIIILAIIFVPAELSSPTQTDLRSVILAIGVDKLEDMYEISNQILIPHYSLGFNETANVVSGKGRNLYEASQDISLHLGKISGYAHVSAIVFGDSMKDENIVDTLDFFLRSKRINNNALVMTTNHSAKNLLEQVTKIDNSFTLSVNNIIKYNESAVFASSITMERFLNNYLGNQANIMPVIETTETDYEGINADSSSSQGNSSGISGSSSSSSSGSGGGQTESPYTVVSNQGKSAIYNRGIQVKILEPEEIVGFNAFTSSNRAVFTLNNVTDSVFNNATVIVTILNANQSTKLDFSLNGKPRLTTNVNYVLKVNQVIQENFNYDILQGMDTYVTERVIEKFNEYYKTKVANAVNMMKQLNADCVNVADKFYKFKTKKWKEFLNTLADETNYMQEVEFFLNLQISGNI